MPPTFRGAPSSPGFPSTNNFSRSSAHPGTQVFLVSWVFLLSFGFGLFSSLSGGSSLPLNSSFHSGSDSSFFQMPSSQRTSASLAYFPNHYKPPLPREAILRYTRLRPTHRPVETPVSIILEPRRPTRLPVFSSPNPAGPPLPLFRPILSQGVFIFCFTSLVCLPKCFRCPPITPLSRAFYLTPFKVSPLPRL